MKNTHTISDRSRRRLFRYIITTVFVFSVIDGSGFTAFGASYPDDSAPGHSGRSGITETVSLEFSEADIEEVIEAIARVADINYIIDKQVRGRVTLHTSAGIPKENIMTIFQAILDINGCTAVYADGMYKIIRQREARSKVTEISIGKDPEAIEPSDKMVFHIVPLKFVSAQEVYKITRRFKSRRGYIRRYREGNILVILDTAAVIKKMLRLIEVIDIDTFQEVQVKFFDVRNADADEVAKDLKKIFLASGIRDERKRGPGISFIPIRRIESIVVVTSLAGVFRKVQSWLDNLDSVSEYEAQKVYIYHVQNGKAKDLVKILEEVYGSGAEHKKKGGGSQGVETLVRGPIVFIDNEATNSIVIKAIPHDYEIIKQTIEQLDIFTQQVLIEVLIGEVTLSGDTEYGVEWALLGDKAGLGGYKGNDKIEMDFGTGGLGTDLSNNLGRGFTYRFDSDRLQTFLVAQASKNKLNILSRPQIMVEDNQEAHIEVGQEVPIITSEYVPMEQEDTTSTSRSIEYRSTGVILDVTPRINENGLVTMEINQEISEAQGIVSSGIQSPVISNRKAETSVAVSDGQTIIIGGIIKDQSSETVSGVPFLSSIPLIRYFFSDTKQTHEKTELIITITPHVVASTQDIEKANQVLQESLTKIKKDVY